MYTNAIIIMFRRTILESFLSFDYNEDGNNKISISCSYLGIRLFQEMCLLICSWDDHYDK